MVTKKNKTPATSLCKSSVMRLGSSRLRCSTKRPPWTYGIALR